MGSAPGVRGSSLVAWRWLAVAVAAALLAGCGQDAPPPADVLADACAEAERVLAEAPAPTDGASRAAFIEASGEAADVVSRAITDIGDEVDEQAISDLAWQLNEFPREAADGEALRVANEASAAIVRIDRFAAALDLDGCGAETWRPADWRTIADEAGDGTDVADAAFLEELDELCARTFPNPGLLAQGTPLLPALIGEEEGAENVNLKLLERLDGLNNRPADAARFIRDFPEELVAMRPSSNLEDEYVALVAAFTGIDAVVPRVIPREPPQALRNQLDTAFEELERAWGELGITC